jgi:superoxide reductase
MAIAQQQVYKCGVCGNEVEVLFVGGGTLVCCGKPMNLLTENTTDAAQEKHVPVIEKVQGGVKVKVGSVAHPMTEEHYIPWIELLADGQVHRQFLKPGGAPEAVFPVTGSQLTARAECNLHGLWKGN